MIMKITEKPKSSFRAKTFFAKIRSTLVHKALIKKVERYNSHLSETDKSAYQLLRLNQVWQAAIRNVKYYRQIKDPKKPS